jgi:ribonucleoside-triphosphate reductase
MRVPVGSSTNYPTLLSFAERLYDKMFNMKFLPGGRGLWAMGADLHDTAALNNCGFVSTYPLWGEDWAYSFEFMMDCMMQGVGIGFDTKGEGQPIFVPRKGFERIRIIDDSREGWVASVGDLIRSYLRFNEMGIHFDYSRIRPKGTPLQHFGGVASGPEPLKELHETIRKLMEPFDEKRATKTLIVDIANNIGKAVVAGGIRRTAMIALNDGPNEEFCSLKDYQKNPQRAEWGWASNNSFIMKKEDFQDETNLREIAKNIKVCGEPGLFILENAQEYGLYPGEKNGADQEAEGTNPCGEQTLHNFELCNLVEVFISRIDTFEEFLGVLELALLYGKVVSTMYPNNPRSSMVMSKNHRIGIGLTGIADFIAKHNISILQSWMEKGYSHLREYESELNLNYYLPNSVKLTTIKPSGTLSLLAGVCPGIHYPIAHQCWRRIRLNENETSLIRLLKKGLFTVYEDEGKHFVKIRIEYPKCLIGERSLWEQAFLVQLAQRYWSDNQVSCTFYLPNSVSENELVRFLQFVPHTMKSCSILPEFPTQQYKNLPFEPIPPEEEKLFLDHWSPPLTPRGTDEFIWLDSEEPIVSESSKIFCESCQN